MTERTMMMIFDAISGLFHGIRRKRHGWLFFCCLCVPFVVEFPLNPFVGTALGKSPARPVQQAASPAVELDEEALKDGIAARIRITRGAEDERLRNFSPDMVTIDRKIPIQVHGMTFFAVKVKLLSPLPGAGGDTTTLVVDKTGTLQFTDIQELASGNSLAKDVLSRLVSGADIPPDFGKEIFKGNGKYSMIVISDPFCPYCRKGWEYIKTRREKLKSFRLSHYPLNRAAQVACLVMADAHERRFKLFEIVDFAYTRLDSDPDPKAVVGQFMDAFPELVKVWGPDPENALKQLEEKYLAFVQEERKNAQALGINFTPVFFVNGEFHRGFNAELLDKSMP